MIPLQAGQASRFFLEWGYYMVANMAAKDSKGELTIKLVKRPNVAADLSHGEGAL
jgi:hypothetical protein